MSALRTLEEALEAILTRAQPLSTHEVAVADAAGRVVREPVRARVDLPPFASSAMDGFAVRSANTPGELEIAFRIAAGKASERALAPGAAAAISTGGVVPEGADTIVPVENAVERSGRVLIEEFAAEHRHIRPRGGDVRAGAVLLEPGAVLGTRHIGALSAAGVDEVVCSSRPLVVVLATGSELRAAGEKLEPGQIYESNRAMIAAVLERAGAQVELLPVVEDEESAHRAALERGLEADVLVSSGGVSMGEHDLVRKIERELGVEEVFWGVAVKPGKPLSFGVRGSTLVFGLPGNPVSSLVGALLFVQPALLALQGASSPGPAFEPGLAAAAIPRSAERDQFVRARRERREGHIALLPVTGQDSHMIVRAAAADALVHVPRGEGEIVEGSPVRFLALD